ARLGTGEAAGVDRRTTRRPAGAGENGEAAAAGVSAVVSTGSTDGAWAIGRGLDGLDRRRLGDRPWSRRARPTAPGRLAVVWTGSTDGVSARPTASRLDRRPRTADLLLRGSRGVGWDIPSGT